MKRSAGKDLDYLKRWARARTLNLTICYDGCSRDWTAVMELDIRDAPVRTAEASTYNGVLAKLRRACEADGAA